VAVLPVPVVIAAERPPAETSVVPRNKKEKTAASITKFVGLDIALSIMMK
jgi:hypothetical protein